MLVGFDIHWHLFIIATLCMGLTPGIAMLFSISESLQNGVKFGVVAALGVEFVTFIYFIVSVVLLSTLFHISPLIFKIIQLVGAGYLIYLGVQALRHINSANLALKKASTHKSLKTVFVKGTAANLLNPKIILFLLAFLPQFIGHKSEHLFMPLFVLGLIFNLTGLVVNVLAALIFNKQLISKFSKNIKNAVFLCNLIPGLIFIGLGIFTLIIYFI